MGAERTHNIPRKRRDPGTATTDLRRRDRGVPSRRAPRDPRSGPPDYFGFNLAVVAGLLIILAGAAGLAWSLGSLTITVDLDALRDVASTVLAERMRSQVQTIGLAAALLTMTLGLWWWAEADHVL